jgi:putative sugar O-methyltransferase
MSDPACRWPLASLEDLERITPRDLEAARGIAAGVLALREWRDRQELDPRTDLPAGNWAADNEANDFMDAHRHVAACSFEAIDNLRYFTNTLTGHKLIHFRPSRGLSSVMPLPPDVRGAIAGNIHRVLPFVDQYMRLRDLLPEELLIRPVRKMGEVGVDVDGVIVNQDTVRQQLTINALWRLGILGFLRRRVAERGTAHVVEVGGGYGSLCYHLKRILPQVTYTIIDLPETLLFSGIYLSIAAPGWRPTLATPDGPPAQAPGSVSLVPNFQLAQALSALPGVDLGINISSFGEMMPEQVEGYGRGLSQAMAGGGLLFECNEAGRPHIKANALAILARHFEHNEPAVLDGFPQYDGYPMLHARQPLATMLTPPPPPRPLGRLAWLWRRLRARPLSHLPGRILGGVRRLIGC